MMWQILDEDKKVLLEGAQGTMLDIDHGTYRMLHLLLQLVLVLVQDLESTRKI